MTNPRRLSETDFSPIDGPELMDKVQPLRFLGDIKADLSRVWKAALEKEGYGRQSYINGQYIQSVDDEIDSLLDCLKLRCYYGRSSQDVVYRRAFLADYACPYFSKQTLQRSILPTDSFVRRVVKNSSMLYKVQATRWIKGPGEKEAPEDEAYNEAIEYAAIHAKSKEWLRAMKLFGCVLVRPIVRMRGKVARLEYDHYTPDAFRVLVDELGELVNVTYAGTADIDGVTQDVVYVWTAESHYMRDVDGLEHAVGDNAEMVNPYGFIPFVLLRLEDGDVYDGGDFDLVDSNIYTNYLELLENTDATFAAVNAFIHTNLGLSQNEVVGPRRVLGANNVMQGDGNALAPDGKFVSGDTNAIVIRDLKESKEKQASQRAGIPAFMLAQDAKELSGKAMKIAMTEQLEQRMDDAAAMEEQERKVYVCTALVCNWHFAKGQKAVAVKLPEDGTRFNIDFGEVVFDDDPKLAYELDMQKVEDGIISIASVARKDNTDTDSDEALLEMIAKNKAQLTRFKAKGFRAALLTAPAAPESKDGNQDNNKQDDTNAKIAGAIDNAGNL